MQRRSPLYEFRISPTGCSSYCAVHFLLTFKVCFSSLGKKNILGSVIYRKCNHLSPLDWQGNAESHVVEAFAY